MAIAPSTVATPRWQRWSPAEERWPAGTVTRALLRLLLALPFAGLALYAAGRGFVPRPAGPLSALVTTLGPLGVGLVAAAATGTALAALAERLVRWQVPVRVGVPLVLVPALAYTGSADPIAVLTVAFLALAVEGFLHFAVAGQPEGAVRAGLMLAGAALCDPAATGYALAFAAVAPFVAAGRRGPDIDAGPTRAMLLFPPLAVLAGAVLLNWRLTGQAGIGFDPAGLLGALGGAVVAVVHTPLYAAVAVVYAVRRPRALAGYLAPVVVLFVTLLAGLAYSAVTNYLLLTTIALIAVPRSPSRRLGVFLGTVALLQWAQLITWPPASPPFQEWLRVVWGF
ncbi:hypothetical protein Ais01nite_56370 [Asanoa ishikariensis]|uniref:Uncharacterized protein n=1 Tax=Asanoa ishikariensis TaxID=137265 RepID=A0A1H3TWB3_9ACTN|nr:hypothetical protein [Asanoa ishikariensis]GIF67602.1 hypothetical protein Ais01nite_56370 [Asanoa ishikariensis]SDZ54533.1 hypothetical protein SAMN05421684_6499 [Asanoa ishikariensis]